MTEVPTPTYESFPFESTLATFSLDEYQLTPPKSAFAGAVALASSTTGTSATDVLILGPAVISIAVGSIPVTTTGSSPIAAPHSEELATTATTEEPIDNAESIPLSSTEILSSVTIH